MLRGPDGRTKEPGRKQSGLERVVKAGPCRVLKAVLSSLELGSHGVLSQRGSQLCALGGPLWPREEGGLAGTGLEARTPGGGWGSDAEVNGNFYINTT